MTKTIHADVRLEAYQSFFDHIWAKKLLCLVQESPFANAGFALTAEWKGVANTHVLPYILLQQQKAFAEAFVHTKDPLGHKLLGVMRDRLVQEMDESLRNMQKKKLQEVLNRLHAQTKSALDEADYEFDTHDAWDEYLKNPEFQLCLWGSQRICYSALFQAYENFVRSCMAIILRKPDYRPSFKRELVPDVRGVLGDDVANYCLTDEPIEIARLVRNAFAHNGGSMSPELNSLPHNLILAGDIIQITAPFTRQLFHDLKGRAFTLAEAAVGLGSTTGKDGMP